MTSKAVCEIKVFHASKGFIGKSVPCTPTMVGWAVLNQYFSRCDLGSQDEKLDLNIQLIEVKLVGGCSDRRSPRGGRPLTIEAILDAEGYGEGIVPRRISPLIGGLS